MSPPGDRVAIRPDALNVAQMSLPIRTHRDVEQPVPRAFMSLGDRWITFGMWGPTIIFYIRWRIHPKPTGS